MRSVFRALKISVSQDGTPLDRGRPRVLVLLNTIPTQSYLGHAANARLNLNAWLTALGPRRSFDRLAVSFVLQGDPGCSSRNFF